MADGAIEVLGVQVARRVLTSWARWLAPEPQPFFVTDAAAWGADQSTGAITPELRDTYCLWRVPKDSRVLWLSEAQFLALPRRRRAALVREQVNRGRGAVPTTRAWHDVLGAEVLRSQADGHRFVWWPSIVARDPESILRRVVSKNRLMSRHREVGEPTWRAIRDVVPHARRLAGTFADGSTACCFSTVLDAVGADAAGACDTTEPFARWLRNECRPGGDPRRPGTVLAWRASDGVLVHAAVAIGDGWALEKPSQEWHSPRGIATVRDIVRTTTMRGQHLERYTRT